jgi:hypothetical protein
VESAQLLYLQPGYSLRHTGSFQFCEGLAHIVNFRIVEKLGSKPGTHSGHQADIKALGVNRQRPKACQVITLCSKQEIAIAALHTIA